MFVLGNLQQNIYKIINRIIPKDKYESKHMLFKKRATDLYLHIFYNYIANIENKGFFTCLKDTHEKERYLDLWNMKKRNALSKQDCLLLNSLLWLENDSKQKKKSEYGNFVI